MAVYCGFSVFEGRRRTYAQKEKKLKNCTHAPFVLKRSGRIYLAPLILLFCAVWIFAPSAYSAPVLGKEYDLRQPDGSTVRVKIWGDEFYQVVESLDGYTLIRDPRVSFPAETLGCLGNGNAVIAIKRGAVYSYHENYRS